MPATPIDLKTAQRLVKNAGLTADRLAHTLAVGATAREMVARMDRTEHWVEAVTTSATLHDIGYGYPDTGHHAVDGARFLSRLGASAEMCAQVAWHSTSEHEVTARGLPVDLSAEFGTPDSLVKAVIWCADFTTSPTGHPITVAERIRDIEARYSAESPVIAALHAARPAMEQAWTLLEDADGLQLPPEAHRLRW